MRVSVDVGEMPTSSLFCAAFVPHKIRTYPIFSNESFKVHHAIHSAIRVDGSDLIVGGTRSRPTSDPPRGRISEYRIPRLGPALRFYEFRQVLRL